MKHLLCSFILLFISINSFAKPECEKSISDVVLGSSMSGAEYVTKIKYLDKKYYNKAENIVLCQYEGKRYRASIGSSEKYLGTYRIDRVYADGKYKDNPELGWSLRLYGTTEEGEKHFVCSASAISPYWIITAEHCVDGLSKNYTKYYAVGNVTSDGGKNQEQSNLGSIYRTNIDLVLVKLKKPMVLRKYMPVNVNGTTYLESDRTMDIYGWGCTKGCEVLRSDVNPQCRGSGCYEYIPHTSNKKLNHRNAKISGKVPTKSGLMSLKGGGGVTFWQGDSGGACVYQGLLYGVVSIGYSGTESFKCAVMDLDRVSWVKDLISIN
jgi:hypothetical protein